MSSAASAPRRVPTRGYSKIPNSLIENQAQLTHAELALALIVCRREGTETPVPVSDRNWNNWTGLSPRAKEYAAAGLKKKGLAIQGRGDTARYRFEPTRWDDFVRHTARSRPRTEGRKVAVEPRKGAKIHPECRDRGCALLEQERVAAAENAQPVAQSLGQNSAGAACADSSRSKLTLLSPSLNAQRVAQRFTDSAEQVWAKTLAALQAIFPLVGVVFLVRLVAIVRAMFADVTDTELAEAVNFAFREKRRYQKSEGLFILTVPAAIAHARSKRARDGTREAPPPASDLVSGITGLVGRVAEGLRARGAPFLGLAAELEKLKLEIPASGDLEAVEAEMQRAEAAILTTAAGALTAAERATVAACAEAGLDPYRAKMDRIHLEELRRQLTDRETLTVLGLPRLSLFFV